MCQINGEISAVKKSSQDLPNKTQKRFASAGNRTRAARVAGEHSTTEPPMHIEPAT